MTRKNDNRKPGKTDDGKIIPYLYVAEGNIEKKFFDELKKKNIIKRGRFLSCKLTQDYIKDTDVIMTRYKQTNCMFCILDTDLQTNAHLDKLSENIKKLPNIAQCIVILVQKYNFEDELKYVLDTSNDKGLDKALNVKHRGHRNLKTHLLQKENYSVITKEHVEKYCTRSQEFENVLKTYGNKYDNILTKIKTGKEIINDNSMN